MKAVKTGYVETGEELVNGLHHHGQFYVNHAQRVIDMAAKHKVAIVAHETVKDTGERRTYPNIISREVARGQEYDAWSADGGNPPNHTAILPFTRMLSGPMDFTPGAFELTLPSRPNNQVNTTLAKQLALYVVIYSPVQMASDLPEHYEQHLDAFQFIKDVPVDWATTRALGGEIGEYVAIARKDRHSDNWFVGALTNEKARNLTLKLDFLEAGKKYRARIYQDAKDAHYATNPGSYQIKEITLSAGDELPLSLAAGGGAAISFIAQ
jgi:alpha-glucosidase